MGNTKYCRWYAALMSRAAMREPSDEMEGHHVQPICLGGTNEKSNIVKLTYREHFLAHWLLIYMHVGADKAKMRHALHMMCRTHSGHQRIISSWQFSVSRRAVSAARIGRKHTPEAKIKMSIALLGRKLTPIHIARMSAALKGHLTSKETRIKIGSANRGRKITEESRDKMRRSHLGKKHTEEHKQKISIALAGRPRSTEHKEKAKDGQSKYYAERRASQKLTIPQ